MRLVSTILAVAVVSACAAPKPKNSAALAAQPLSVHAPGAISEAPPTALSPEELTERVHDLERRGRSGAATRLAAAHGDVGRAALEASSGRPDPATRSLAAAFDRASPGEEGWSALLALRAREPARFAEYDAAHSAVAAAFASGDMDAAERCLPLPVPAGVPGGAKLWACSQRLEGLAALARGAAEAALVGFLHGSGDPALFQVLAAAAAERAGDAAAGDAARASALAALASLADGVVRRREPALLERVLRAHGDAPAAEATRATFLRVAARDLGVPTVHEFPCAAWTVAGCDRLARGEPRAALVDLRRAEEAAGGDTLVRGRLREAQARALLASGEPAAARAVLGILAAESDARVARPALATLGAVELRLQRPEIAAGLLRLALAEPAVEWPGATAARANLGLALLSAGLVEDGLAELRAAEAQFELEQDYDALWMALENEIVAHELSARSEDLEAARARLASLASR